MKKATIIFSIFVIQALAVNSMNPVIRELWSQDIGSQVTQINIGQYYILALSDCAYVFNSVLGTTVMEDCNYNSTVTYNYGRFALVAPDGTIEVYDDYLSLLYSFVIPQNFTSSVLILPDDKILACYRGCALFDAYGNVLWENDQLGLVLNRPSFNGELLFVPVNDKQLVEVLTPSGTLLYSISVPEAPWSIDACGRLMAVKGSSTVFLYNVTSSGYELWWTNPSPGPYGDVKFSKDCNYLIAAGSYKLLIYNVNGTKVLEMELPFSISSIDWRDDLLVIGGFDGSIRAYKLDVESLSSMSSAVTADTNQIPSLGLVSLALIKALRRKSKE
ncbi:hypothetical protein EYM_06275 [Ignicoccus islandicus DSM 13165]|uniref:Anaphase-promoting complex subunit 4 WD40 domain-containing protein n=1 Tax=Ignicoccus islandicus DSM 13165 TaxID=940295 RepID=A0A0U3FT93_9CREN|nr:hypothetical protein [Ignicoccus islandicus]ALU12672.1 hypothetical protein EYM_06275 [Ignicoccus islandicus DSM 13165]